MTRARKDKQSRQATLLPLVIAHRGASGYLPEHTLAAYWLAIGMGADFIEPDLVPTRDGVLIARHDNELSSTTDVADHPEFSDRKTTKLIDGDPVTGWFSEDFSLEEIKTLRVRERIPHIRPQNKLFDGLLTIPSLEEILDLLKRAEASVGRKVGVYPETKHPTYFAGEGKRLDGASIHRSLGRLLVETLVRHGFVDPQRVFIQSFEIENLMELHQTIMPEAGVDFPLIQLIGDVRLPAAGSFSRPYDMFYHAAQGHDLERIYGALIRAVEGGITNMTGYGHLIAPEVLRCMAATYADGIGPWKETILPRETAEETVGGAAPAVTRLTGEVAPFLAHALRAGLHVHPYTLRTEEVFRTHYPQGAPQSIIGEIIQLLGLGVDGFFIDQPDYGTRGRDLFFTINDAAGGLNPQGSQ